MQTKQTISHSIARATERAAGFTYVSGISRRTGLRWLALLAVFALFSFSNVGYAQQGHWIWTGKQDARNAPVGSCHFRKTFSVDRPTKVEMIAAGDDKFIVHVNGKQVGYGMGASELTRMNLTSYIQDGENLVAVQVINSSGKTAAFACQIKILEGATKTPRWIGSDSTWKVLVKPSPKWKMLEMVDRTWDTAAEIGKVGTTMPWDRVRIAQKKPQSKKIPLNSTAVQQVANRTSSAPRNNSADHNSRFKVPDKFKVSKVLDDSAGSIIALEFNEFGQLLVSQEGGGLKLVDFNRREPDGTARVTSYCDKVSSCQGILPLNGKVFVIGYGPEGSALYELTDKNRDGVAEKIKSLVTFKGEPGEHGPHGMVLGTDGMIYIAVGNASGIEGDVSSKSPATNFYDVDMLPRQEDRAGHAAGVKAPGGTIVRVSLDGQKKEIVASGLRNTYDLAINSWGEMFFHDSDMEADTGTPWYRPTQVYQMIPGADYGWRSGWSKSSYYYLDCTQGICDTGRGSPTGAVVYDHVYFPMRYHGAMFLGDWSEGRILAVSLKQDGAGYRAEYENFLEAQPLTVTDLAIGPDGALYFSTGGRATEGGVYRVSWEGGVPESITNMDDPLSQLVRQPQPQSAWGRQQLAKLKISMGVKWQDAINGIVKEKRNKNEFRIRAMNLMLLYGPKPNTRMLDTLCSDDSAIVRAKAAEILGTRKKTSGEAILIRLLEDPSTLVRTKALQSLQRIGSEIAWTTFERSLASEDKIESMAARRLLETLPTESWRETILATEDQNLFCQGTIALMTVEPSLENAYTALARVSELMDGFVSDARFVDLLRVAQVALDRGNVDPTKINLFGQRVNNEFPAGDGKLNRELSKLIAYLGDYGASERIVQYLELTDNSALDKFQVALSWQVFAQKLTSEQRLKLIGFLENSIVSIDEVGQRQYAETALDAYLAHISDDDVDTILSNGAKWPTAALQAFYRLPESDLSEAQVAQLVEMDKALSPRDDAAANTCKLGIVALLGERGNEAAHKYLREVWHDNELRRNDIVMGLAQRADGENWKYLVDSLIEIGDDSAREVVERLVEVDRRPSEPSHYRDLIVLAYRLRGQGGMAAIKLMEHWTDQATEPATSDWREAVQVWSKWFSTKYPDSEPVNLEQIDNFGQHSISRYLDFMESDTSSSSVARGKHVFTKAQCTQCHRFDKQGEALGPDLTSLARRFSKREALESIIFPSRVISDQYLAHKILTVDGQQFSGMMSKAADGSYIIIQADGTKVRVPDENVEDVAIGKESAMPNGLIDRLSTQEIADLIAYLYKETDTRVANKNSSPSKQR